MAEEYVICNKQDLVNIADAIRSKTGSTDTMAIEEFPTAINDMGDKIDMLIDGTLTEAESNAGSIRPYAFCECSTLTKADFPNATSIGLSAFQNCSALTTANIPNATSVGSNAFYNCSALTTANIPNATSIENSAFSGCSSLTTVDFPNVTNVAGSAFQNCYKLTTVILRSATLCTLVHTNAFNNCYHFLGTVNETYNPNGLKDGYIYVPSALINSYKAAANWSTYASQFRALEDYTVDGTITGELDATKI